MSHNITIDDDTYEELAKRARGFEKPGKVLRRVLGLEGSLPPPAPQLPSQPRRPGRPPGKKNPETWRPEQVALLGCYPDRVVSEMTGIPENCIYYKRHELGIPPARKMPRTPHEVTKPLASKVQWTAEYLAKLGHLDDKVLAEEMGITEYAVFQKRKELGIQTRYRQQQNYDTRQRGEAIVNRIRQGESTSDIAKDLGVCQKRVYQLIKLTGIKPKALVEEVKEARRANMWTPERLAQLGVVRDEVLAAEMEVPLKVVWEKRISLGIRTAPIPLEESKRALHDLKGQRFGKLIALRLGRDDSGKLHWVCRCDCGQITLVRRLALTLGNTKSCGCASPRKRKYEVTDETRTKMTQAKLAWWEAKRAKESPDNQEEASGD